MKAISRLDLVLAGALLVLFLISVAPIAKPALAQESTSQAPNGDITISVSLSEKSVLTGEKFTFDSVITNKGSAATSPFTVSLNFTSLDPGTYVDPEDWSPKRTLSVDPIEPGATATQTWTINPILEGDVAAYVVTLPNSPELTTYPLIASPAIHIHVGAQRSLNPGGVLPVVVAVPGLLAVAFVGLRVSNNRRRT